MNGFQLDEVENGIWRGERPSDLMANPVERDQFSSAKLPHNFQEHGAQEGISSVDGRAAESMSGRRDYLLNFFSNCLTNVARCLLGLQGQFDVLNHVGEKFKVLHMAQSI